MDLAIAIRTAVIRMAVQMCVPVPYRRRFRTGQRMAGNAEQGARGIACRRDGTGGIAHREIALIDVGQCSAPIERHIVVALRRLKELEVRSIREGSTNGVTVMLRSGANQSSAEHLAKWERGQAPSAATVVRLLNLLKSDADLLEVERELKREPVLSYRLLRFVNSASAGFHKSISSFRQAVVILGYHQLHRWLAVLLVTTAKNGDRTGPYVPLWCASFMETLAMGQSITLTLADQCFMVGVFSRLDELLGSRWHRRWHR